MKKKLGKIISLMLVATMIISLVGCNGCNSNSPPDDDSGNGNQSTQKTDIKLVDNSRSDYKIVVPVNATSGIENASNELQTYLHAATGAKLDVIEDSGLTLENNGKYISIGETTLFEDSELTVSDEELNRDGYKIKRFDNTVVICGANDLGTLYGVYEFLSYEIGFEPYSSSEIYYRTDKTVMLNDFNVVDIPSFRGRATDGPLVFDKYSAILLRYRNMDQNSEMYDHNGAKTFIFGHSESYGDIIPRKKFNNPDDPTNYHPEWFDQASIQMCLTSPSLIDEVVRRTIEELQNNTVARYVNISQNDGAGFCECATCSDETERYTRSGNVIRFQNKVIERVEAWRMENQPDRELIYNMFAYSDTANAPVFLNENGDYEALDPSIIPHEKLAIRLTRGGCLLHRIDDPNCTDNAKFYENFKGYRAICNPELEFTIYDYNANYTRYLTFIDLLSSLKENLLIYKNEMQIADLYYQNYTGLNVNYMSSLTSYVLGKLMWDVNEDVNTLINNFMNHYYKEAAPAVKKYYDFMCNWIAYEDATNRNGFCMTLYNDISASYRWPKRVLEQAMGYLDEAIIAAKAIPDEVTAEIVYKRVLVESCCLRFIIANSFNTYYPAQKDYMFSFLDQWEVDCHLVGISATQENPDHAGGTVSKICDALREAANG